MIGEISMTVLTESPMRRFADRVYLNKPDKVFPAGGRKGGKIYLKRVRASASSRSSSAC